jgi:hypothetical protein
MYKLLLLMLLRTRGCATVSEWLHCVTLTDSEAI